MPKPNTRDAMKRFRAGKAGFTDKAHLKAKGLIPRADGTKRKSPQYEDAPANATGTAVAGTGDDSSTVVVRRKKDKEKMKDRLLRRFKIKETIDRLVPAIEPPTDEVRERVDQLKELAKGDIEKAISIANKMGGDMTGAVAQIEKIKVGLSRNPMVQAALRQANEGFASAAQRRAAFASGYKAKGKKGKKEDLEKDDEAPVKTVIKGLKKAVATHTKQAKSLEKQISDETELEENKSSELINLYQIKNKTPDIKARIAQLEKELKVIKREDYVEEDMDRQPQDKDVKKVKGTQPKKYYKTLPKGLKKKRADFFSKQKYKKSDDDDDYKPAPGDKGAKTKPSIHTKKFKKLFGEIKDLNEKIKGLENKAKKTGMPYGILKKVYDRGMAAWKGGHRPGTTQQQWAFARVNSFVTKSSGTWGGADKDLAKKVRAAKK